MLQRILPLMYRNQLVKSYSHECCDIIDNIQPQFNLVYHELHDIFDAQQCNLDVDQNSNHRLMIMACIADRLSDMKRIKLTHRELIRWINIYQIYDNVVERAVSYLQKHTNYDYKGHVEKLHQKKISSSSHG